MVNLVMFLAGVAAAASVLVIWYFGDVQLLNKERAAVKAREDRLQVDSANLAEKVRTDSANLAEKVRDLESWRQRTHEAFVAQTSDLESKRLGYNAGVAAFDARKVQYESLLQENSLLKQDLFNSSVHLKKTERDHAAIVARQTEVDHKTNQLANRYLDENVSWISGQITPNNFAACKKRLLGVIEACRGIGFGIPPDKEVELVENLKKGYEDAVRKEFARQEQSRIKAQIREEEKVAREREKRIQEAKREEAAKQTAREKVELAKASAQAALERAKDSGEMERLKAEIERLGAETERLGAELQEAKENTERAISNAQMTKSGNVYVISNIGAFGEGVFKVGMTRRDDPEDRVSELSSASVPFPFDVQMLVTCNDAPALESALHNALDRHRVNKANPRKEFFRVNVRYNTATAWSRSDTNDTRNEPGKRNPIRTSASCRAVSPKSDDGGRRLRSHQANMGNRNGEGQWFRRQRVAGTA